MIKTQTEPMSAEAQFMPRNHKKILVVEDEKDLADLMTYNLKRNGYDVLATDNGNDALEITAKQAPDLVLLDLMLPGIDGTEVARRLRSDSRTAGIPIIMVTAKSEETDVIVGLTLGADDYITKPFSTKILLARVATILRRAESQPAESNLLKAGPLSIDIAKHAVFVDGQPMRLTLTEFKLLSGLVNARGRVLTRAQLMDKAMGTDVFVTDRAIDVHVTAIRKKLGDAHWLIQTVRGVGYKLQESSDASE
jgi:two-component system phosphate regulon response regulator PhoB